MFVFKQSWHQTRDLREQREMLALSFAKRGRAIGARQDKQQLSPEQWSRSRT